MSLNFGQRQTISDLADLMYDFLPGSGASSWRGHVSFASIARQMGIGQFWPGGSKKPAIAQLLQSTLDRQPQMFTRLIEQIVAASLTYRTGGSKPLTREEIETLNSLLLRLNFKIPGLWDETFLASLPRTRTSDTDAPRAQVEEASSKGQEFSARLEDLKVEFLQLRALSDRPQAGLKLEKLLNDLFKLFGLEPRPPFRVTGEQIDGSFILDYETYLVEAKWTETHTPERDLLEFRGIIEGKSRFTRGVFISINGFTDEAIDAITRGMSPTFFLLHGYDLYVVLDGKVPLGDLLRYKFRRLTEEGSVLARYPLEY